MYLDVNCCFILWKKRIWLEEPPNSRAWSDILQEPLNSKNSDGCVYVWVQGSGLCGPFSSCQKKQMTSLHFGHGACVTKNGENYSCKMLLFSKQYLDTMLITKQQTHKTRLFSVAHTWTMILVTVMKGNWLLCSFQRQCFGFMGKS